MKGKIIKKSLLCLAAAFAFLLPTTSAKADTNEDISINVETDKTSYKANEEIMYTITVNNNTENELTDMVISHTLSENAKITGVPEGVATVSDNSFIIECDSLLPGYYVVYNVSAVAKKTVVVTPEEPTEPTKPSEPTTKPSTVVTTKPSTTGKGSLPNTGGTSSFMLVLGALALIGAGTYLYIKKGKKVVTSLLLLFTMFATFMSISSKSVSADTLNITTSKSHTVAVDDMNVTLDINITANIVLPEEPVEPEEPTAKASIEGLVVLADDDTDLTNNQPLEGVTVEIISRSAVSEDDPTFAPTIAVVSTSADGKYIVSNLEPGDYTLAIAEDGYLPYMHGFEVTTEDTNIYLPTIELVPMDKDGIGTAEGTVFDAFTGQGVKDITLNIRKYVGDTDICKTVITDENGNYSVELDSGTYIVEAVDNRNVAESDVKYSSSTFSIKVLSDQTIGNQNGTITPIIAEDQLRVVLTWGEHPYDLDSHLVGPSPIDSNEKFHTYFSNKDVYNNDGELVANLDLDDTTSYGPETTTIYKSSPGTYSFYVHDYTNRSSDSSNGLGLSGATVKVYSGATLLNTFNVPNIEGTQWHVFDYNPETGAITAKNVMSYQSRASQVGLENNSRAALNANDVKPGTEVDTTLNNGSVLR